MPNGRCHHVCVRFEQLDLCRILLGLKPRPMKRLVALIMCAVSFLGFGQGSVIQEFPFNPDSNGDDFVGVTDLQSFLASYGQSFGSPPPSCVYDGSSIETWFVGILQDSVILDSVWFEMTLQDEGSYFVPGCPDPIVDTVSIHTYGMLRRPSATSNPGYTSGLDAWGSSTYTSINFNEGSGTYSLRLQFNYLQSLTNPPTGFFYSSYGPWRLAWDTTLPFTADIEFSEEGYLLVEWDSSLSGGLDSYLEHFLMIPYWHYAE